METDRFRFASAKVYIFFEMTKISSKFFINFEIFLNNLLNLFWDERISPYIFRACLIKDVNRPARQPFENILNEINMNTILYNGLSRRFCCRPGGSYFLLNKLLILIFLCVSSGCHTGIESTKTISLSKSDRKQLAPTAEEMLMEGLQAPKLDKWREGKMFLVSDKRASLVFDPSSSVPEGDDLSGRVIEYAGLTSKTTPGGGDEAVMIFKAGDMILQYSTGKTPVLALESISSMDVPMLIDLDLVDKARDILLGRKVWTRSQLWYDQNDNKIDGRKFVPVEITDVSPGTMVFPLKISIKDETGAPAVMFMNAGNAGMESRTFQNIFSLTDPKDRYPDVRDEVWSLVQRGKVRLGMTKDECKLSLGNPAEVNSGHDWNSIMDIWRYANGAFLRFQDGLLVDFRN